MPNLKAEVISPVFGERVSEEETFKRLDTLAEEIYNKHSRQ